MQIIQMADRLRICIMAFSFWGFGVTVRAINLAAITPGPLRGHRSADIGPEVWLTLHRSLVYDNPLGRLIWHTCSTVRLMKTSCRLITRQQSSAFGREDRTECSNWASKVEKKGHSSDTVFVGARQACQNWGFHAQSSPVVTENREIVSGLLM